MHMHLFKYWSKPACNLVARSDHNTCRHLYRVIAAVDMITILLNQATKQLSKYSCRLASQHAKYSVHKTSVWTRPKKTSASTVHENVKEIGINLSCPGVNVV